MTEKIQVISPVDNKISVVRGLATLDDMQEILQRSVKASSSWKKVSLKERARLCNLAVDKLLLRNDEVASEITLQIGRPISHSLKEMLGLEQRARYMIEHAGQALSSICIDGAAGEDDVIRRYIEKQPLGIVCVIAPWNYPLLTAVNSIIPAIMAGNCVILKHSAQTPLCAERFYQAFCEAGLPEGVFQYLHASHRLSSQLITSDEVDLVSFTGSVAGGVAIEKSLAGLFKHALFELGGKDAAYVRADADIDYAARHIADGGFYNAGQSCCAVERVYVDKKIETKFMDALIKYSSAYVCADPFDVSTTMGPVVNHAAAERVSGQINEALGMGAECCMPQTGHTGKTIQYLQPQILSGVTHDMSIMRDETFGPVLGVMSVESDAQALDMINDSPYGLTASLWTNSVDACRELGSGLQVGTVYMNECDYLDPALAWSGLKLSGRGCSLSVLGYDQLTQSKSFYLKTL